MTMLERVARVLLRTHYERGRGIAPDWKFLDRFEQEKWRISAHAAIKAMREPTEAMVEAIWAETADPCWTENAVKAWQAGIDEALAGTSEPAHTSSELGHG